MGGLLTASSPSVGSGVLGNGVKTVGDKDGRNVITVSSIPSSVDGCNVITVSSSLGGRVAIISSAIGNGDGTGVETRVMVMVGESVLLTLPGVGVAVCA